MTRKNAIKATIRLTAEKIKSLKGSNILWINKWLILDYEDYLLQFEEMLNEVQP